MSFVNCNGRKRPSLDKDTENNDAMVIVMAPMVKKQTATPSKPILDPQRPHGSKVLRPDALMFSSGSCGESQMAAWTALTSQEPEGLQEGFRV